MKQLYQAGGLLSREFTGQITYTFCLPYPLEELDICLAFEKRRYDSPEQVPVEELAAYCRSHYDTREYENLSREELADLFFRDTKTEIHLSASLNDKFIGCIHKQLTCRHMHFGAGELSEGCLMPEKLEGVLKVTVLAFQVLMDDTPYTVTVSGRKAQEGAETGKDILPDKAETVQDKEIKQDKETLQDKKHKGREDRNGSGKTGSRPFLNLELHNHTTESDASITCEELLDYMIQNKVDAFALTDHNTISGHAKMEALLESCPAPIQCIYGMEYTTYYGHILCLNLREYVPWDSINPHRPELIFRQIRETGALAGIAHPFSYGYPFATGCRFDMQMTDYSAADFIEIFNDLEPLHTVNVPALMLWEDLILQGYHIAATCGMDLHGKWDLEGNYATFIENTGAPASEALSRAVRSGQTWVSKGPLLTARSLPEEKSVVFEILDGEKPGCPVDSGKNYIMTLRLPEGSLTASVSPGSPLGISWKELGAYAKGQGLCPVIPKLYEAEVKPESLLCVSPVLYLPLNER